jgi:GrpB-like predicted nucleotidyltransferase (UPF0157 family)
MAKSSRLSELMQAALVDALDDEISTLEALAEAKALLDARIRDEVAAARADKVPWVQIGDALGMTRQAAWERFHRV